MPSPETNLPAKKRQQQRSREEKGGVDTAAAASAATVLPSDLDRLAAAASQEVEGEDEGSSNSETANNKAKSARGGGGGGGGKAKAKAGSSAKKAAAKTPPAAKKKTKAKLPVTSASPATKAKVEPTAKPKQQQQQQSKRAANWSTRLTSLTEFKNQHGHTRVPRTHPLAPWIAELRSQHSKLTKSQPSSLTPDRIASLNELDFEWKLWTNISWEERLESLKDFVEEEGHCNVPIRREQKQCLGTWVDEQRKLYRKKRKGQRTALSDGRERQLNALGFQWYVYGPTDWSARLEELRQYKDEFGTCAVPLKYKNQLDSKWKRLANWVSFQRLQYKLGSDGQKSLLTEERKAALDGMGFVWTGAKDDDGPAPTFESRLEELRAFRATHGHCDVPTRYGPNKKMANWVKIQRRAYKRREAGEQSSLTDERMRVLEALGFKWKVGAEGLRSTRRMNASEASRRASAEIAQPRASDGDGGLGRDIDFAPLVVQDGDDASGVASMGVVAVPAAAAAAAPSKVANNSSSFGFVRNDEIWNRRLEELAAFKSQHGNCNVPSKGKVSPNPPLGKWTMKQRVEYRKFTSGRKSQITQDRIDRLNDLDFDWNPGAAVVDWSVRLDQLRSYGEEFGHCNVPKAYPANPALGQWVQTQRVYYKKLKAGTASHMTQERIDALEALGFVWHVGKGKDGRKSSEVPEEEGEAPCEEEGAALLGEVGQAGLDQAIAMSV